MAGPALKDSVRNPASRLVGVPSAVTSAFVGPLLVEPVHVRSSAQNVATVSILNAADVALARPGLDATSVYAPGALSARSEKLAAPSTVAAVVVPVSVPA